MELAPFVVCPETLGPLVAHGDGFVSGEAGRRYEVREGLVFMGYPAADRARVESTMAEEHAWQGTSATVERDLEFLRVSAPVAAGAISLASSFVECDGHPRALELGCGSGWVSWLLARAGYDTWMCDFEANSLAIGLMYEHQRLGEGRRFAADARFAPFAGGTFDVVVCKEFVHHLADYPSLFEEVNRLLRPGGVLLLMEPTRSVLSSLIEVVRPDPHAGHMITWLDGYRRALRRAGFSLLHETAAYWDFNERRSRGWPAEMLKRWAARSVQGLAPLGLATALHMRLLGGASAILVSRKTTSVPSSKRPAMAQIDPGTLVITRDERALFGAFPRVLADIADKEFGST